MLVQNVVPELTSDQPFLRSRACWLYGEFGDLTFADEESLKKAIDGIYKNLFAVELPVRLSACLALSKLLANKTTQNFLKPALQSIFEVYLKTMDEIDCEELVQSLDCLMSVYQDDISGFTI